MLSREVIQPKKSDKRYARRDQQGQFTDNRVVPQEQGDRGDQKKKS
jgi:hypothetical protein